GRGRGGGRTHRPVFDVQASQRSGLRHRPPPARNALRRLAGRGRGRRALTAAGCAGTLRAAEPNGPAAAGPQPGGAVMRNANRSRPRCVALALLAPWLLASAPAAQPPRPAAAAADPVRCAPGNRGIRLGEGFCAAIVADDVGPARHIVVAPSGDVFVAIRNRSSARGGILVLRDTTGDGAADIAIRFGEN